MSESSNENASQTSANANEPGTCEYTCVQGSWRLVADNSNPGFFCPNNRPGICTGKQAVIDEATPEPPNAPE